MKKFVFILISLFLFSATITVSAEWHSQSLGGGVEIVDEAGPLDPYSYDDTENKQPLEFILGCLDFITYCAVALLGSGFIIKLEKKKTTRKIKDKNQQRKFGYYIRWYRKT